MKYVVLHTHLKCCSHLSLIKVLSTRLSRHVVLFAEFPFRLDKAGNILVWFKNTTSPLCAHITDQDALALCKRFEQTRYV